MEEEDPGYSGETMITKNRTLAWLLVKLHIPVIYETAGIRFYCPDQLSMWRADTLFEKEPETLEWIRENEGTLLDIGASTGIYSLYAAKMGHRVIACEIDSEIVAILKKNIRINNMAMRVYPTTYLGDPGNAASLIKIDTDGAEVEILRTHPDLIKGAKSIMIEESPEAAKEIQEILTGYGFSCQGRYISPMMERSVWKDYRNAVWTR